MTYLTHSDSSTNFRRVSRCFVSSFFAWLVLFQFVFPGFIVSSGNAQPPPGKRFRGSPEERRDRIRMVRMWRLIDVLDLEDGQSERFFLALKRSDTEQDRLNTGRERLSRVLMRMNRRPETTEKALVDTMLAIQREEELLRQAKSNFRAEAAKILSVRQQAHLMLFEQRFDHVLREAIMDIMKHRGRRGGEGRKYRMRPPEYTPGPPP